MTKPPIVAVAVSDRRLKMKAPHEPPRGGTRGARRTCVGSGESYGSAGVFSAKYSWLSALLRAFGGSVIARFFAAAWP